MNIVELQIDFIIVDDMFIVVCKYLDFKELMKLQLLSKYNQLLIQKTKQFHTEVKLNNTKDIDDKVIHLATNFNFMCYDLSDCDQITDDLRNAKHSWGYAR